MCVKLKFENDKQFLGPYCYMSFLSFIVQIAFHMSLPSIYHKEVMNLNCRPEYNLLIYNLFLLLSTIVKRRVSK